MNPSKAGIITLENDSASLTIDPFGGAITSFCLKENNINPLSFCFSNEQMPANNKAGASYQGHFACIGRWGEPSPGEIRAGLPNHGEPANINWTVTENIGAELQMETLAAREKIHVARSVTMDERIAVYAVKERITNVNLLARLFNIVQHPTLAAPFLDGATIVDCNASTGFNQALYKKITSNTIEWPLAKDDQNNSLDLRNPQSAYNAVFSFVVNPADCLGWITAYSAKHNLLLGYVWKRTDYPWIHLWQHYNQNTILYRGIEFGTAGIHQPFHEILNTATMLFAEKTFSHIDAGEAITKSYVSFLNTPPVGFAGVKEITFSNDTLLIKATAGDDVNILLNKKIASELSK